MTIQDMSRIQYFFNVSKRACLSPEGSACLPQWEAVELLELDGDDHFARKQIVFDRIFFELGPGESKSALDQDVEIYIGWFFGFKRKKIARIAKIVEKRTYGFL